MMKSSSPRKQRKFLFNMPLHLKHKLVTVQLSKELREKFGIRNMPLRVGDKVKVVKGSYKGKSGKVSEVDLKRLFVKIEGITRKKADGTEIPVKFRPWNLVITDLDLKDEERKKIVQRRGGKMVTQEEKSVSEAKVEEKQPEEKEGEK
ncbi:MAG: 50S ribosomal protein L24 [Caldisphaera sp.]|uniref:50S ribosomal protein L24 n=1 Tax=Caldisphaera sp. TaxID=2060322 RepID=UPI000CC9976C|nr:50S ribosomal protein L24 [Caldisphaera sp.]PMP60694.1 MAG: 50S ribosomal protein L24 [Caldisphaera sp.]PMP89379.1 MAG: 50S ribosomal protein L24 [Caldisphaera sp.]